MHQIKWVMNFLWKGNNILIFFFFLALLSPLPPTTSSSFVLFHLSTAIICLTCCIFLFSRPVGARNRLFCKRPKPYLQFWQENGIHFYQFLIVLNAQLPLTGHLLSDSAEASEMWVLNWHFTECLVVLLSACVDVQFESWDSYSFGEGQFLIQSSLWVLLRALFCSVF